MAKQGDHVTLSTGPYRGCRYVPEPNVKDAGSHLWYARNMYIPDPDNGSGIYARPGFIKPTSVTSTGEGQGVTSVVMLDGTFYNFLAIAGKIYRRPTNLNSAPVDVTPTNVVIATTGYVYFGFLNDQLIVNDGVNKPWIGTNLGGTPITATPIEYQTPATILSIGSNDVRLANTAFTGTWSGVQATFAANAVGTAVGALGQIAANTWGIILVEASNSTTLVFTAAFNAGAGYASETLAIAALPARTASRRYVGYVTVRADAGAVWIAGTDAFAGGSTGNQAQTTNYYAGEGAAWSAFGQPTIYYGAVFLIANQLATVASRSTILWSEPALPAVGYQQTDYDNLWALMQTGSRPLYALQGTNDALYYFRSNSIGALGGAPGVNFQGSATHDVVAGNVGCTTPRSVQFYLGRIFFMDQLGRPWRFAVGGFPEAIWSQARVVYDGISANIASDVIATGWAVIEPTLNLYLCARVAGLGSYTVVLDVYDADSGDYMGGWDVVDGGSTGFKVGGVVLDASGTGAFCFLQRGTGSVVNVWHLARVFDAVWSDDGNACSRAFLTLWQAYSGATTVSAGEGRVMMEEPGSAPAVIILYSTTSAAISGSVNRSVLSGNPNNYTARVALPTGLTNATRGIQMNVNVTAAQAVQWKVWGTELDVTIEGRATAQDY